MNPNMGWVLHGIMWFLAGLLMVAWPGGALLPGGLADPLLVLTLLIATFCRPGHAALWGLASGVIAGGISGGDMAGLCLSRIVLAFALSMIAQRGTALNKVQRSLLVGTAALLASILLILVSPPAELGRVFQATLLAALINVALAFGFTHILQYWFVRRVF